MLATAPRHLIDRPKLQCFGRAPASLPASAAALTAAPGGSTFRVIDDRASCRVTAKLLIIDKDMAPMPEWLRQAFPAPTHRSVPTSPSAGDALNLEAFLRQCLTAGDGDQYAQAHRRLDRLFLARVLEATDGNQHSAARRLGIARHTLRTKLRELGLHLSRRSQIEVDVPL